MIDSSIMRSGMRADNRTTFFLAPLPERFQAKQTPVRGKKMPGKNDIREAAKRCRRNAASGQDETLNRDVTHPPAASRPIRARAHAVMAGLAAILTTSLFVPPTRAEAVPIPQPAPQVVRTGEPAMLLAQAGKPEVTGTTRPPDPIIPDPRRNVPASIFATFDANQKAAAGRVSSYLSSLRALAGKFVQIGPDGSRSTGEFYIQKPGKVRFEYDPPSPIAMISDGSSLVIRDTRLATQDVYPLSQTPLRYLLSDRIDLMRETNVVAVTSDDLYISVIIEEKQALVGTSRLMLMVGVKDGKLKQWTITDPQGYDTTVAIYNLNPTAKLDPALFRINDTTHPASSNN